MDNLTQDDFEELRKKRVEQLKAKQNMMDTWKSQGHGKLEEIADEKQFFEEAKTNKLVVCHFYRSTTPYCLLLDQHLMKISPKHMETRFIKLNAEKCDYLVTKLRITVMPTLIIMVDNYACGRVEGFTELGNTDKFSTEKLEQVLGEKGVIDYVPPPPSDLKQQWTTSNPNNKDGNAIYASARTKMIELMNMDDDFLNTTDEEA